MKNILINRISPLVFIMVVMALPVSVQAGVGFTLIADEENTKDMSVNFLPELFHGKATFGGLTFNQFPIPGPEDDLRRVLNHNTGVLDVTLNLLKLAPLTSASLLRFENLEQQLKAHCWDADEVDQLSATLRLYVIPPTTTMVQNGQQIHHRLNGSSPHGFAPPVGTGDFPPASMPVGVYRHDKAWDEGDINLDFLQDITLDSALLLDVQRAGVVAPGTIWEGITLPAVDLCLNRIEGAQAAGLLGDVATLCYDSNPDWQPWMEWDVTAAVRHWLQNDFASAHGFSLFQTPHEQPSDQTRINNLQAGNPLSRAILSFASSSAQADCGAAGGSWGGDGAYDFDGGFDCKNSSGQIITPIMRPEWRPQLLISTSNPASVCSLTVPQVPGGLDAGVGNSVSGSLVLINSLRDGLNIDSFSFSGPQADRFSISDDQCRVQTLALDQQCSATVTMQPQMTGLQQATLVITFHIEGETGILTQEIEITGNGSSDSDGISDDIENLAPNNGDGNNDGIADSKQTNVTSLRNADELSITFVAPAGMRLHNVRQVGLDPSSVKNTDFEHGFYGFDVLNIPVGGSVNVQIVLPDNKSSRYFKFGSSPTNNEDHWYEFLFDDFTGAVFGKNNRVTLHFVDGERGDRDLAADGRITADPGGFGVDITPVTMTPTDATVGSAGLYSLILGVLSIYSARLYRKKPVL